MRRFVYPDSARGKLPFVAIVLLVVGLHRQLGVALAVLLLATWALFGLTRLLDV